MKRSMIIVGIITILLLPLSAQTPFSGTMPQATFQSTSTMVGSGSAYASTPMLNADGTAAYSGATAASSAKSGPRRIGPSASETPDPNDLVPIGDAILPLILMVMAYTTYILLRRRKKCAMP